VNKLISNVPKRIQHGLKHLAPVFAARRKQRDNNEEKPVCLTLGRCNQYQKLTNSAQFDLLTWLMDEAKGKEATDWYLTSRILTINFAAIHTSSMVCRFHNYCANQFLNF